MKKIFEKVCTLENYPYLCIRNHEKSSLLSQLGPRFRGGFMRIK